jgi:hypothetical protein
VGRLGLILVAACSTSPGGNHCQVCDAGCSRGLTTAALVLTPPGCGAQCYVDFCPGGCSTDAQTCLGHSLPGDGGSCVASQLTSSSTDAGVAITSGTTVILAASATDACRVASSQAPTGKVIVIHPPQNSAGTFAATIATLFDGNSSEQPSAGSVELNVNQAAGVMGSYSLTFMGGTEEGSFIAPACDVCASPP